MRFWSPRGKRIVFAATSGAQARSFEIILSGLARTGGKEVMRLLIIQFLGVSATAFGLMTFGSPVITSPHSATTNRVSLGSRLVLTVDAASTVSALSYQWRLCSEERVGATNSTWDIARIQTDADDFY